MQTENYNIETLIEEGRLDDLNKLFAHEAFASIVEADEITFPWLVLALQSRAEQAEAVFLQLLEIGCSPNALSPQSQSILMYAVIQANPVMVGHLLQFGANPRYSDQSGYQALHLAAEYGHSTIVQLLLDAGVNPNVRGVNDETPLHRAMLASSSPTFDDPGSRSSSHCEVSDHVAVVNHLLNAGADLFATNLQHQSPLYLALSHHNVSLINYLIDHVIKDSSDILEFVDHYVAYAGDGHLSAYDHLISRHHEDPKYIVLVQHAITALVKREDLLSLQYLLSHGLTLKTIDPENGGLDHFIEAIYQGDLDTIDFFMAQGVDIQGEDSKQMRPLDHAALSGQVSVVQRLISAGAPVDPEFKFEEAQRITPVMFAAKAGYLDVIKLLHSQGADIFISHVPRHQNSAKIADSFSVARLSAQYGHLEIIEYLCSQSDNPSSVASSVLPVAARYGQAAVVDYCLSRGGSIAKRDPFLSGNAIQLAAEYGFIEVVDFLLNRGCHVEGIDTQSPPSYCSSVLSPLICAIRGGHTDIVALLLERGANVEGLVSGGGDSALTCAAELGREAMVDLLIDKGADIHAISLSGNRPLLAAAKNGHVSIVEKLHYKGAKLGLVSPDQGSAGVRRQPSHLKLISPLCAAVEDGHLAVVESLVYRGARLDQQYKSMTVLMIAAKLGHVEIVEYLLAQGVPVDRSINKMTALKYAAQSGHLSIVKNLVEAGAKIEPQTPKEALNVQYQNPYALMRASSFCRQNASRQTAIDLAVKGKHREIQSYLKQAFKSLNAKDASGMTPLMHAASEGDLEKVKQLIAQGASFKGDAKSVPDPVRCAVVHGHLPVLQYLLPLSNISGFYHSDTPWKEVLLLAVKHGHLEIVQFLAPDTQENPDYEWRAHQKWVKRKPYLEPDALCIAAAEGDLTLVEYLIGLTRDIGRSPGKRGCPSYQSPAIIRAIRGNHLEVVRCLIRHGVSVSAKPRDGFPTTLSLAVKTNNVEMVRLLLKKGASSVIDCKPIYYDDGCKDEGRTPLMEAVYSNNLEMVTCLVDHGASLDIWVRDQCFEGTAVTLAIQKGYTDIIEYFRVVAPDKVSMAEESYTPQYGYH